jgi:CheY-like chemotaxis protein
MQKEGELARAPQELNALRAVGPLIGSMTRPKILLVETTDDARNAMKGSLENQGCDVSSVETAAEGLSQILEKLFDVLIIDLHTLRVQDQSMLVAAMRTFQLPFLLLAVGDPFSVEEFARAISLEVDFLLRPSEMSEVPDIIYARAHQTDTASISRSSQ